MEHAILVHSPEYANWVFDKTHPTQGRRFLHARNQLMLEAQRRRLNVYEIEPQTCSTDDLHLVHSMDYVFDVTIRGECDEWVGQRHDLGDLAKMFVSGTLTALDVLLDKKTLLAVNYAGAKHRFELLAVRLLVELRCIQPVVAFVYPLLSLSMLGKPLAQLWQSRLLQARSLDKP